LKDACNNRAHNQQEEKQKVSWLTPNICGNNGEFQNKYKGDEMRGG